MCKLIYVLKVIQLSQLACEIGLVGYIKLNKIPCFLTISLQRVSTTSTVRWRRCMINEITVRSELEIICKMLKN